MERIDVHEIPGVFRLLAETFAPQPPAEYQRDEASRQFIADFDATTSALAKSGAWSMLGFFGASVVAAGLVYPVAGLGSVLTAVALVLIGVAVATFSWVAAWRILDAMGDDPASKPEPPAGGPREALR